MSTQNKNMSFSKIKQENDAKFNKVKRVIFDGNVTLDIDQSFRETKIEILIQELLKVMAEALDSGKEITNGIGSTLMTAAMIKHFTSLETDAETFEDFIILINALQDREYLNKILESFDQTEVKKLFNTVTSKMNLLTEAIVKDNEKNKEIKSDGETI
jgi:hypothetical protein